MTNRSFIQLPVLIAVLLAGLLLAPGSAVAVTKPTKKMVNRMKSELLRGRKEVEKKDRAGKYETLHEWVAAKERVWASVFRQWARRIEPGRCRAAMWRVARTRERVAREWVKEDGFVDRERVKADRAMAAWQKACL